MNTHPETIALLRETLEKYVKDLAEELLYWVEEMNKLDAGGFTASGTTTPPGDSVLDETDWTTHPGGSHPDEGSARSPGKGA